MVIAVSVVVVVVTFARKTSIDGNNDACVCVCMFKYDRRKIRFSLSFRPAALFTRSFPTAAFFLQALIRMLFLVVTKSSLNTGYTKKNMKQTLLEA